MTLHHNIDRGTERIFLKYSKIQHPTQNSWRNYRASAITLVQAHSHTELDISQTIQK